MMNEPAITLEQLIALNDEMAAIARVGVPLELGLQGLDRELSGRLGRVAKKLRDQLEAGASLEQAISACAGSFPPAYRAIVLAGLKSGRLSAAFESVASTARRVAEVRRSARLALVYPLLVMVLAYFMFVYSAFRWIPELVSFYRGAILTTPPVLGWLLAASDWAWLWAPLLPMLLLIPAAIWYRWFRHGAEHPLKSMRSAAEVAMFADLLAAMVEREIPLDQAVVLAANATGSAKIEATCHKWAEQIQRGEPIESPPLAKSGLPHWLVWLLQQRGARHLSDALRQAARSYREDVLRRSRWFMRSFPLLATAVLGGSATLLLAVLVLGPWFYVLFKLAS